MIQNELINSQSIQQINRGWQHGYNDALK